MVRHRIFRNEQVRIDKNALAELNQVLQLEHTIEELAYVPGFFDHTPALTDVINTPDFHKGAGIPIGTVLLTDGFVVPQAIGNDINCGMRLYTTSLTESQVRRRMIQLEPRVRQIFFEGARELPMCKMQREAIFKDGLRGLLETCRLAQGRGLWRYYNRGQQEQDIEKVDSAGSLPGQIPFGLDGFLGHEELSYDNQSGSIGGGNHFVEVQKVAALVDKKTAYAWGLKEDQVVVMIHTGSLAIGHHIGMLIKNLLHKVFPSHIKQPANGIYVLPESSLHRESWTEFWALMNSAANFAFANRLFLGLMAYKALAEIVGDFEYKLLYDAPHNLIWQQYLDDKTFYLHRKGACPARGITEMQNTHFAYYGEPVFIPGSMGAKSYIMVGQGNRESLFSASHGAGRSLSRGAAMKTDQAKFEEFIERFKVITPIDPSRPDIKGRPDILKKWKEELKAEAPYAYKEITPIIQTHVDNKMARVVAELEPIFTVKA